MPPLSVAIERTKEKQVNRFCTKISRIRKFRDA
jgi:hypothetical protein